MMPDGTPITREKLLEALDSEIAHAQASLSSSGRSHWALTLSLSALLWLAIQGSTAQELVWQRAILLAIAMTIAWDFVEQVARAIDAPLLRPRKSGKFIALSRLLGALRSIILFWSLKRTAMLLAVFWIAVPQLTFLKYYFAVGLAGTGLSLAISFIDAGPTAFEDVQSKGWIRASNIVTSTIAWLARIVAISVCGFALYGTRAHLTAADVRMGIIIAAFAYLLTELVEDRFPANHLAALRTIRQNLAFERVTVEEAKRESDILLFTGGSASAAMQHSPDSLLAQAAEVRARYEKAKAMGPRYRELIKSLSQPQLPLDHIGLRAEYDSTHATLLRLRKEADTSYTKLQKRLTKLQYQIKAMALFSSSTAREMEPLVAKLKAAFAPIDSQRKNLAEILETKLTIVPPSS